MKTQINQVDTALVITKSNWGGAQKYVFDLAVKATQNGQKVTVIFGGDGELATQLKKLNINTISLPNLQKQISIFKEFSVFVDLVKVFKKIKPKTIHLNSSKIGGIGSLAGRFYNLFYSPKNQPTEIVFTAHGWAFNENTGPVKKFFFKISSFFTILLSHKVLVLSEFELNQVKKWPFCKNKLQITNLELPPINFLEKTTALEKLTEKLPLNKSALISKSKIVGTIAELNKNKGLIYGLEAFKNMGSEKDRLVWLIIGSGEDHNFLEKKIIDFGLQNKVFFLGQINEAAKYMKAFDVFLLPSVKEGLPYVLLEAEMAEIPIIATDVGGIKERFNKSPNNIIEAGNVEKIIGTLNKML